MRLRLAFVLLALVLTAIQGAIVFACAGRLDLPQVWWWVGVGGAGMISAFLLIEPSLVRERFRPGPGAVDQAVIQVLKLLMIAHFALAGFDVGRWHITNDVPPGVTYAGLALYAGGLSLFVWAMIVNRFFSSVVRLQDDRDHVVVSAGPYSIVRHPGYLGYALAAVASGVALGSWISIAPAVPFVALILRRLLIEDRFLKGKLPGYEEYAAEVRWRLVPGLW